MQDSDLLSKVARSANAIALGEICMALAHEQSAQLFTLSALLSNLFVRIERSDLKEIKAQISTLVDGMQATLNRLRVFASPREYSREPLEKVIRAATDLLSVRSRDVTLRIHITAEAGQKRVPSELLLQVLVNILLNALDSISSGSGSIVIDAKVTSSHLCVSVTDNGPGVPDNLRGRIWEPFFTTSPTRTGLGLAVVRQLLTEIGGSISLDSGYVRGARFVVHLPIET